MRVSLHFLCSIFLIVMNTMIAGCTQSHQKNLNSLSLTKERMHISQDSAGVYIYCESRNCLSRTHKILRTSLDQPTRSMTQKMNVELTSSVLPKAEKSTLTAPPQTINKNRAVNKKRIHKKKVVKPKCLTKP